MCSSAFVVHDVYVKLLIINIHTRHIYNVLSHLCRVTLHLTLNALSSVIQGKLLVIVHVFMLFSIKSWCIKSSVSFYWKLIFITSAIYSTYPYIENMWHIRELHKFTSYPVSDCYIIVQKTSIYKLVICNLGSIIARDQLCISKVMVYYLQYSMHCLNVHVTLLFANASH